MPKTTRGETEPRFSFADDTPARPEPTQQDYAQRMLDFVLRWPRESIATTDMMTYGPRPRQNAEETLKIAALLEKQGWLIKKDTPQKNMRHWTICRRPFVHPKLATAR